LLLANIRRICRSTALLSMEGNLVLRFADARADTKRCFGRCDDGDEIPHGDRILESQTAGTRSKMCNKISSQPFGSGFCGGCSGCHNFNGSLAWSPDPLKSLKKGDFDNVPPLAKVLGGLIPIQPQKLVSV
jgi:hypothetical protein